MKAVAAGLLVLTLMFVGKSGGSSSPVLAASSSAALASAVASSPHGPISILVTRSPGASSSVSVTVTNGKLTFEFEVPAKDFTVTPTSATLNTGSDLKSYGTINITWKAASSTNTSGLKTPCGTSGAGTITYYTKPSGTASLKLPCLAALVLKFGGPVKVSTGLTVPTLGAFSGTIQSASLALSSTTNVALYFASSKGRKANGYGFLLNTLPSSSLPLTSEIQIFHAGFPMTRLQVQPDLSSASVDLSSGPTPFKGTKLNWTAGGAPRPTVVQDPSTCASRAGIGARRAAQISGTVSLQTCFLKGTRPVPTGSIAEIYSSAVKAQVVTPTTLVSTTPADKSTDVPSSTTAVSATFSAPITTSRSIAVVTPNPVTPSNAQSVQFIQGGTLDGSRRTITFTLSSALLPHTSYTLRVNVMDANGQSVSASTSFTTGS